VVEAPVTVVELEDKCVVGVVVVVFVDDDDVATGTDVVPDVATVVPVVDVVAG
jgi:hypothetical protein